jgi:hypothetical protein
MTGNFAFGLREIRDSRIIEGLNRVAARDGQGGRIRLVQRRTGAGFGKMDDNRRVELAAVRAITRMYEARGWDVESKQSDCLGYDLLCRAGRKEHHVESKVSAARFAAFR